MDDADRPSLLDAEARGGDIAREGFRFQSELAIARIPLWLTRSSFIEIISEAMGDVEARFFSLEHGTAREFAEYKNHEVTPADFWRELERFEDLENAHPGAYFRFSLVCPGVGQRVVPIVRALQRLRPALPFYDDAPGITEQSVAEFVELVEGLGKSAGFARFLLARVVVDIDPPRSVVQGLERFRPVLEEQFPIFSELGSNAARTAYGALAALLESRIGAVVARSELLDALWGAAPAHRPKHDVTAIKTLTQHECLTDIPPYVPVDWSAFTGGESRTFPPTEAWEAEVAAPLKRIAAWITASGRERRVQLEGQRRLSAAFAFGAAFRAVTGFTISTNIHGEQWRTDAHPASDEPGYEWEEQILNEGVGAQAIAISIGVLRDPLSEVVRYLDEHEMRMPMLSLVGADPIVSSEQLNGAGRHAKTRIMNLAGKLVTRETHLFMAVPSQFALFFGHRSNSIGTIYCYEWTGTSYAQSCTINAR